MTFPDFLGIQRPPSGEQLDLVIAINSFLLLKFYDLWILLKLIKLSSYKCMSNSVFWNLDPVFCEVGRKASSDIPKIWRGRQGLGIATLYCVPQFSSVSNQVVIFTLLSLTRTGLLVCDFENTPKYKKRPLIWCFVFISKWTLCHSLEPRFHTVNRMCWKPKADCYQTSVGSQLPMG
jgi:hypothetical protein